MSIEQEKMIVESLSSIYPMQKFEEDAIETVLDALPRWIPCSERLPKDNRQVLVYARSVHYALAKYDEMRNADGTYKKQWVTFDAWKPLYTIKEVIAWMPLPEPYKPTVPPECEGDCGWCKPSVIEKCKGVTE